MADENKVASIDVHKKVLMVVAGAREGDSQGELPCRRFGTTTSDLRCLSGWLREQGVTEVVLESTAPYWKPVWMELEPYMRLHLAQAFSNRAPKGRKHDFRDAVRLRRRFLAGELILSFVPDSEQRAWRTLTRMKTQRARHRVRLYGQVECLLEEMRIKLSCVLSDLFGASGLRILRALAGGETDPKQWAGLGDERLKCTPGQLLEALRGDPQPMHPQLLTLYLQQLQLIDPQIAKLSGLIAEALKPHQEAVARLAEVPGLGPDSAQQVIAEVGVEASSFPSARNLASWVGTCPGENESAEENHSRRPRKGTALCGGFWRRRRTQRSGPREAICRPCSAACCPAGAIRERLGPSPTGCAAGFGRSCMRESAMWNKVPTATPRPESSGPGPCYEPCANSATTSKSHP